MTRTVVDFPSRFRARARAKATAVRRIGPGYLAFALLTIVTWAVLNMMIAFGIVTSTFILMANGHWDSVFVELDNLARHYLDAPIGARVDFQQLIGVIVGGTTAVVSIVRIKPLVDALADGMETRS